MPSVLIVDREPEDLTQLEHVLTEAGYGLRTVHTPGDARACLEQAMSEGRVAAIDAVLVDWSGPETESLELLDWLAEVPESERMEVLIRSSGALPEGVQQGLREGAYYHVKKGVTAIELHGALSAALASRGSKASLREMTARVTPCFAMLSQATFEIRTMGEAELLSAHIGSACADPQRGIAVLELLINGIEHGNLGINYDQKTELLRSGAYERELERRLRLSENRYKSVRTTLTRIGEDHLQVLIADSGPGFDYDRYQRFDRERLFHSHGRGILLAGAAVEVEYFKPGNQVRATLPL